MAESASSIDKARRHELRPRPRRERHGLTCTYIIALMVFLTRAAAYLALVAAVGWWLLLARVCCMLAACARCCGKVIALPLATNSRTLCSPQLGLNDLVASCISPAVQLAPKALSPSGLETPADGHCGHLVTSETVDLACTQQHGALQRSALEQASEPSPDMDWDQQQLVAAQTTRISPSETAEDALQITVSPSSEAAEVQADAACIEARLAVASLVAEIVEEDHDGNTASEVAEGSGSQAAVHAAQYVQLCAKKKKKHKANRRGILLQSNMLDPAAREAKEAEAEQAMAELLQQVAKEKAAEAKAAEKIQARKNRKGAGKVKQAPVRSPGAPGYIADVSPAAEDAVLCYRDSGTDDTVSTRDGAGLPESGETASDLEAKRRDWDALLEQAARCTDPQQQQIMLARVSQMMPCCSNAGISIKYGRKVLQRLQAVSPARKGLLSALRSTSLTYEQLDAALMAAKGCRSLLPSDLLQLAAKKMAELSRERAAPKQQQQAQQQHDHQQATNVQHQQQAKRQPQQQQRRQAGQQRQMHGPVGHAVPTLDCVTYAGSAAKAHSSTAVPGRQDPGLPGPGCRGFVNLGDTCYINSMLQCMNCYPELAQLRSSAAADGVQWQPAAAVGPALVAVLTEMWAVDQGAISPHQLKQAVTRYDGRWGEKGQQDGHEFLQSLLAILQDEANRVKEKPEYCELSGTGTEAQQAAAAEANARSWNDSFISDLFGGLLQDTVTCSNCSWQRHRFDTFLDLAVPIPNSKQVSLQDCLAAFVEGEVITGSEKVKCPACQHTCDATKKLQIYTYPKLLVLMLKRFGSCSKGGNRGSGGRRSGSHLSKNQTAVMIDGHQPLDLAPCCSSTGLKAAAGKGCGPPRYELLAVCQHSGGLDNGHYTTLGKSVADGNWNIFNDKSVTAGSCPSGSSRDAYILFFRLLDG